MREPAELSAARATAPSGDAPQRRGLSGQGGGTKRPAAELRSDQALALRMTSLLLSRPPMAESELTRPADVAGVVEWLGAMQAQDLGSGLWSFGVRLPKLTVARVEAALERREALRTWPMRGTVHFVPSRDARWMLELMGRRPLANAASRRAYLGLSERTANRAVEVLGEALAGGRRLTRAECLATLEEAGIEHAGQRGYHLLWYASQRGVTCVAPNVDGQQTFVLLDEWVPNPALPERDEALATIALRYFRGHGPATRPDFAGWTGLPAADVRQAIAGAGDTLTTVSVDGKEMIMSSDALDRWDDAATQAWFETAPTIALPGFDEYLLGFKDRSLQLDPGDLDAIIPGGNGVFRSTIVQAGRAVATWTRTIAKNRVTIDVHPLPGRPTTGASERTRAGAEEALRAYARFLGAAAVTRWGDDVPRRLRAGSGGA